MRVSQKQSYKSMTTIAKDNSNFYIMDKIREFLDMLLKFKEINLII
jgi:hypothetical protein